MAMPLLLDSDWTAERWPALPEDGKRYEVLDGELWVTPSPTSRHNAVAEEFYDAARPSARPLCDPVDGAAASRLDREP